MAHLQERRDQLNQAAPGQNLDEMAAAGGLLLGEGGMDCQSPWGVVRGVWWWWCVWGGSELPRPGPADATRQRTTLLVAGAPCASHS